MRLLERAGWDVNRHGLSGAPRLRVITSEDVHGTCVRAAKLLGIGTANIEILPSDAAAHLTEAALRDALAREPDRPAIVVLQAGDVNCGAFDPFESLIPLAHQAGAWVHVDGAMGLWAHAVPGLRHLLAGAQLADSWATDGHKWLNVPYDCGYAFVAHPEHHRAGMEHRASYLVHADDVRDELDWTPEHSRRARGFATYAALRELGRDGVADLVARCCRHAHELATRLGALPGARDDLCAADQPGTGALLRRPSGRDQPRPRSPDRCGHGRDQRDRRGVLYRNDLAGPALHAGLGVQLADDAGRYRSSSGGGRGRVLAEPS